MLGGVGFCSGVGFLSDAGMLTFDAHNLFLTVHGAAGLVQGVQPPKTRATNKAPALERKTRARRAETELCRHKSDLPRRTS